MTIKSPTLKGIGGHHRGFRGATDEWLTPPHILNVLGTFDLSKPWSGRVWLNPPYGPETGKWLEKLADHNNGVALVFARTETDMFHCHVWPTADAILFLRGRLHFHYVDGQRAKANAGGPSILIAYGAGNVKALKESGIKGRLVEL